jgi:uncharacterized protein involved in exopolysaccharide biosynthesis
VETTQLTGIAHERYQDDIDLLRYGRFMASYWIVLATGVVAGALGFLALAAWLPARFQSTATLLMTPPSGATPLVVTTAVARAMVTNSRLVSETIKEIGLDGQMSLQEFIDDAMGVQPVPSTNIVKVSVTLKDPAKARQAATLLATKLVEFTRGVDRDGAAAALQAVETQMTQAKAGFKNAEQNLIEYQTRADVEGLEAEIDTLRRQHRQTATSRAELYRRRLEIERLHTEFLVWARAASDLTMRYQEARTRASSSTQLKVLDLPMQSERPLPRKRVPFAVSGALVGLVLGFIASLLINRRRIDQRALA